jgi:hypothetical protein
VKTHSRNRLIRYTAAVLCALAGATALVLSTFGDWTDRQDGSDIPLSALWEGLGEGTAGFAESLFVPLAIAAALALAGVATRIRLVVALAGLIGLTTAGLFLLQQSRTEATFDHLHQGWTNATGGAALLIIAAVLLPRRRTADTT